MDEIFYLISHNLASVHDSYEIAMHLNMHLSLVRVIDNFDKIKKYEPIIAQVVLGNRIGGAN